MAMPKLNPISSRTVAGVSLVALPNMVSIRAAKILEPAEARQLAAALMDSADEAEEANH